MQAGQTAASLRRDAAIQRIHERRAMPPCSLLTAHRQTVDIITASLIAAAAVSPPPLSYDLTAK